MARSWSCSGRCRWRTILGFEFDLVNIVENALFNTKRPNVTHFQCQRPVPVKSDNLHSISLSCNQINTSSGWVCISSTSISTQSTDCKIGGDFSSIIAADTVCSNGQGSAIVSICNAECVAACHFWNKVTSQFDGEVGNGHALTIDFVVDDGQTRNFAFECNVTDSRCREKRSIFLVSADKEIFIPTFF